MPVLKVRLGVSADDAALGTVREYTIATGEPPIKTTIPARFMLLAWEKKIAAFDPQADLEKRVRNFGDRLTRP